VFNEKQSRDRRSGKIDWAARWVTLRNITTCQEVAKRNKFKLKLVNKVIASGNTLLGGRYKPFDDFSQFDDAELPTNSDVTMILAQYIEQTERFRSDHVIYREHKWQYVVDGELSGVEAKASTQVGGQKK
jgi:hypothetical protein